MTIVNIPEPTYDSEAETAPSNTGLKKITLDENQNAVQNKPNSSTGAQNILNEMFSNLTPQRRNRRNNLDTSSLTVNARSISPEPRSSQAQKCDSRNPRPAPSPTPVHSRPTSARHPNKENIPPAKFSAKDFRHFCFDDDVCMTMCKVKHKRHMTRNH